MDGLEARLNASVQFKLSFFLSAAILVVAVVAGVFSFLSAFDEAHDMQDDLLREVATLAVAMPATGVPATGMPATPSPGAAVGEVARNEDARLIVQRVGGASVQGAAPSLPLPPALPEGLQTLEVEGETYRVLVRSMASGGRIAVSQEVGFRNEIARASALRTVMPFLVLVPILLLIVGDLVRKLFRPIAAAAREIDQRDDHDLRPVPEAGLPVEVKPFVVAINRQFARVEQAMAAERRFVADAAHELRSPLTALSLQAERLAESGMSDTARERLGKLLLGIQRGRGLVDQLLSLARAQASVVRPDAAVSVHRVFRQVLEDLMPLAEARSIDIGVEGQEDVRVWVGELDLVTMIRNLVDNAIRYTPSGGRVDLSAERVGGAVVLRVRDNGPGIAAADKERVFDPFYRVLGTGQIGSGLGLSIVRTIALRNGAILTLADVPGGQGLCVCIALERDAHAKPSP